MMATIHAGYQICQTPKVPILEYYFYNELVTTYHENMNYAEHLGHFLSPEWIDENSFCMDGGPKIKPTEVYVGSNGLCFFLNAREKIYSERYLNATCFSNFKLKVSCSASQHLKGNNTAKCLHNSRVKNGMTIELSGNKPKWPAKMAGNFIFPMNCRSTLGILHIHSSEQFWHIEAAYVSHKEAYDLVVTPKITTTDDGLRNFHPTEFEKNIFVHT